MSMLCRPMWPFLLMYGSHDMRHIVFPQVDGGQWDPREMGHHSKITTIIVYVDGMVVTENDPEERKSLQNYLLK